jgi:hypothetical protein
MLNCYYNTTNKDSKCNWVMDSLVAGWPGAKQANRNNIENVPSALWGIIQNNKQIIDTVNDYWFWDMPYYGRYGTLDNFYWRVSKNCLHTVPTDLHCEDDRFRKWNVKIKENPRGDNILICPSSETMTQWYTGKTVSEWTNNTIETLKKHTDRPIVIREKPRSKGTSGPLAEKDAGVSSFKEACNNTWCVVTSVSMVAVEAQLLGIPTFCDISSFAKPVSQTQLELVEHPLVVDCTQWLSNLAYLQYTHKEIETGLAKEFLDVLRL